MFFMHTIINKDISNPLQNKTIFMPNQIQRALYIFMEMKKFVENFGNGFLQRVYSYTVYTVKKTVDIFLTIR